MTDEDSALLPAPNSSESQDLRSQDLSRDQIRRQRLVVIGLVAVVVITIILAIISFIYLSNEGTPTEQIRDIMIIFVAFEFMVLGLAMVILIIQMATLINLFQNEIRPILESTNETVNTMRGTATFLSDNLVEPVIKVNEYISGIYRLFEIIGIRRK